MDDPLAGLEELISSTMAVVDAPSAPGNSLETQGNKVAAAKDDPNGVAIPALDSLAELASIDLGPLDAATPVATPAKEVLLNSTPSVLVSQSGSPGDIDLIGSLTQISVPVTMVNMHGPTSPQGGGLGPAFSVDLHEDVPLQRSVLSSSQPAHVQPLASFSDPLAPALSSTHTNDYDPFSGRSGISANASTLAPPQRSIGSTTVGTHEPLAAFPSHTSSYSSQDTHGLGHVRSGVGAGSSSAGYGQLQPEASGSVSGNAQRVSIGGRSAAAPDEEHPVKVWVREPEKQDGVNRLGLRSSHYTYCVRTEATLPSLRAEGTEVRRRFSEFDGLHKLLRTLSRGYIVPPVPEKSFLDARLAQEDFLRLRRADLQAFLRSIVCHPVLRESEAVRLFLLQPGELQYNPAWIALSQQAAASKALLFGDPVTAAEAQAATGGYALAPGSGYTSAATSSPMAAAKASAALAGLVSWVKQSVLAPAAAGKHVEDMDDEERQLRQSKELMKDLQKLLQLCGENARRLCAHAEAYAADLAELGRNMGMLSHWEEALLAQAGHYTEEGLSAQRRAGDAKSLAYALTRQTGVWKHAAVKTAASLVPLHDYFILVPEAVSALEERERLLERVWLLAEEVQVKKMTLASGKAGSRQSSVSLSLERLEEALRAAREAYALVKGRNQAELARLQLTREKDFHSMAANFMRVQAQLMASSADTWAMAAQRFAEQSSTAGAAAAAEASPLRQDGEWVDEGEACTPTAAAGSFA